jgi:hypothetical protein
MQLHCRLNNNENQNLLAEVPQSTGTDIPLKDFAKVYNFFKIPKKFIKSCQLERRVDV